MIMRRRGARAGSRAGVWAAAACISLSCAFAASALAQAPSATASTKTTRKTAAAKPPAQKEVAATPAFVEATAAASKAREANRLDEAIALYLKAVTLKPDWTEGWWYLATMSYELDRHEPARDAFRRVVHATPNNPSAWGFLGLSEFALKNYDAALGDLLRARSLGVQAHKELAPVVRYHAAILLTRAGQPDQALLLLNEFAVEGNDVHTVLSAFGLAALRTPMLPDEVPGTKRDLVMMAGRAQYFSAARMLPAARQAFEQLVARYPETPNVHYAYGVFLLGEEPDLAIRHLEKELTISRTDTWTMLQLAFEYIKRSDYETASTWAHKAVDADPTNFAARKALGQARLEVGDIAGAIEHLEAGVAIAPDSPPLRFQLAKAYQKAGRSADAQRERSEFVRLDRLVRTSRLGSNAVGGVEPGKPPSQEQTP